MMKIGSFFVAVRAFLSRKKRPFALAEVCVSVIVVGICISYVFTTMNQTIHRYATLRDIIVCNELADENLARCIGTFLTSPPDFSTAVEGGESVQQTGQYEIQIQTKGSESDKEPNKPEKEISKKASLVTITVTVHPNLNTAICATRSTTLCVAKEGS